nr:probable RNA-binding protein 46 isoform X2 [Leptinotarsa decemlineata]
MASSTEPLFDMALHKMICSKGDYSSMYDISHVNGQFIATFKHISRPRRGTEIYIRNIPVDLLLQDILEFAIKAGNIYQIRILIEFSGYNRGYCFVSYFDVRSARKAVVLLDGEKINGSPIGVTYSLDNHRLELLNVPKEINSEEVLQEVSKIIGNGLQSVQLMRQTEEENAETDKYLLKYESHKKAVEARKKVYPTFQIFGKDIQIEWNIPVENKSKRLYFANAQPGVRKSELYEEIVRYVDPENILNMFMRKGYGYILFINEKKAFESLVILRTKKLCGTQLKFSFLEFRNTYQRENDFSSRVEDDENGNEKTVTYIEDGAAAQQQSASGDERTLQTYPTSYWEQVMVSVPQPAILSTPSSQQASCAGSINGMNSGYTGSLLEVNPVAALMQNQGYPTVQDPRMYQQTISPMPASMPNQGYPTVQDPRMYQQTTNSMPALISNPMQMNTIIPPPASPVPAYTPNPMQMNTLISSPAQHIMSALTQNPVQMNTLIPSPAHHVPALTPQIPRQIDIENSYLVSGIPYSQRNDEVFPRYLNTNETCQFINLSPATLPYNVVVLQVNGQHY